MVFSPPLFVSAFHFLTTFYELFWQKGINGSVQNMDEMIQYSKSLIFFCVGGLSYVY